MITLQMTFKRETRLGVQRRKHQPQQTKMRQPACESMGMARMVTLVRLKAFDLLLFRMFLMCVHVTAFKSLGSIILSPRK
jgi:hypothetical protein